jgi:hypothetical protein
MNFHEAKSVLGVEDPLTTEVVQSSFRRLVMNNHPDRFLTFSQKALATRRFIKIKEARDVLLNSIKNGYISNLEKENKYTSSNNQFKSQNSDTDATSCNSEYTDQPYSLFEKIVNKFPDEHTPFGAVLEFLLALVFIPALLVLSVYLVSVELFQNLFQKIGIESKRGSNSLKERVAYLIIITISALAYLPIVYIFVSSDVSISKSNTLKAAVSVSVSSLVFLFIFSEWIGFLLMTVWVRHIKSELRDLTVFRDSSNSKI